eukprot:UN08413
MHYYFLNVVVLTMPVAILFVAYLAFRLHLFNKYYGKKYTPYSTAEQTAENIDLTNAVAIVTGANSGIGKETVRILLKHNATVIMACRNKQRAENAKKDIIQSLTSTSSNNKNSEYDSKCCIIQLDTSSLKSVHHFVTEFNNLKLPLNYLINNAGIMALPRYTKSVNGYEMQFMTNYLGHFLLTKFIIPNLLPNNDK